MEGGPPGASGLLQATIACFEGLADTSAIPYQTLINLYLGDGAASKKELRLYWESTSGPGAR